MYDIVIIGAGPAGMTAAIYSSIARKKVLILEKSVYGGQIVTADKIKNYPGFEEISGFDFATKLYNQLTNFDVDIKLAHDLLLGATPKAKGKELGLHPADSKPVVYFKTGKFGPYVQHNRVFASIPTSVATEETITLELAIEKLAPKEPKTTVKKTEVKEKPKPKK